MLLRPPAAAIPPVVSLVLLKLNPAASERYNNKKVHINLHSSTLNPVNLVLPACGVLLVPAADPLPTLVIPSFMPLVLNAIRKRKWTA